MEKKYLLPIALLAGYGLGEAELGPAHASTPQELKTRVSMEVAQSTTWATNFMTNVQNQICPEADTQLELTDPDKCDADYDYWTVCISRRDDTNLYIGSTVRIIGDWTRNPSP